MAFVTPSSRDILLALLDSFVDARDALHRDAELGHNAPDSVCLLFGPLWHEGSYAQLERALIDMRSQQPVLYWHIAERFTRCTSKRAWGCPQCKRITNQKCAHRDGGLRRKYEPTWISVKAVSFAVKEDAVEAGIAWLDRWFAERKLTPYLPDELFARLAA
jgi:hypothetical protein